MIGWLTRRRDRTAQERVGRVLAALEDGAAHYIYNDLDKKAGLFASQVYEPLAYLERNGLVESGLADVGNGRRRRWYRLKETP